uniref:Equilibrative nucleoside transporter n=1 Tax=Coccolithus braarudii TaxID=221442 RepID=A0A7S0L5P3_9EUKA
MGGPLLINDVENTVVARRQSRLAAAIVGLMGVGALFPWNAFITPLNFYQLLFHGTPYDTSITSILSATFTGIGLIAITVLQGLQHSFTIRTRIIFAIALELIVFAAIAVATAVLLLFSDHTLAVVVLDHSSLTFALLMVCVSLAAVAQAVLTGSVVSYASILGDDSLKTVSTGMGIAGLLVSSASLLTELPHALRDSSEATTTKHDVLTSALCYFSASVVVLLVCLAGFLRLERMDFVRLCKLGAIAGSLGTSTVSDRLDVEASTTPASHMGLQSAEAHSCKAADVTVYSQRVSIREFPTQMTVSTELTDASNEVLSMPIPKQRGAGRRTLQLLVQLWQWALALVLCYSITIGLFPALTGMLATSSHNSAWEELYVPFLFVVFNLGDVIGRNSPACVMLDDPGLVLLVAILRIIFIPLFIFSHMGQGLSILSPWFESDTLTVLIVLVFAVSNGWLTTNVFLRAPVNVVAEDGAAAGTLMAGCLNAGLTIGALLSFLFHWLVCQCNPFVDSD